MLIDDGIKRILYMYDKDSKEWYEHFTFNCQEPGFTPHMVPIMERLWFLVKKFTKW